MPVLIIPNIFVPFTKIVSAQTNANFGSLTTLLNTTKLDDTNIQNAGITPQTKLNKGTGTAGQFLSNNGTSVIWANNPLSTQFNVIMGSAAQVTAGTATHSTFASVTQADGDRILVLPGYVTSEAWALTAKLWIQGLGNTSQILGAVTFGTGSGNSRIAGLRTTSSITINSGITGIYAEDIWFSSTNTFVDNNTSTVNVLFGIQE